MTSCFTVCNTFLEYKVAPPSASDVSSLMPLSISCVKHLYLHTVVERWVSGLAAEMRVAHFLESRLAAATAVTMFPPPFPFLFLPLPSSLYVTLLSLSLLLEKKPPESTAKYGWNCTVQTLWVTHALPQTCWYIDYITTEVNSGSHRDRRKG